MFTAAAALLVVMAVRSCSTALSVAQADTDPHYAQLVLLMEAYRCRKA